MRATAETPGAFLLARLCSRPVSKVNIMNDKVLDRVHKLGPVAITVLAVLAFASARGASQRLLST
jgi:hypothetical protein